MTSDILSTGNAPGRYSIGDECDGCGLCASFSSYTFAAGESGARYFIARQPQPDSDEEGIVRDAMAACPLECIRDAFHGATPVVVGSDEAGA